jgi:hypothetical protein
MSREIKFRAWQDNKMIVSPINSNYGLARFFGFLYEDAPLMQFTGLHDKNGKEIYEGDIVQYADEIRAVEWRGAAWGYSNVMYPHKIEVIGNIFENPDLL